MDCVLKTDAVCVIDNILKDSVFKSVWAGLQDEQFNPPQVGGYWHKVWRLTSGSPVWGKAYSAKPTNPTNYLSPLWDAFQEVYSKYPGYVTQPASLTITPYIYPPGSKLPWHTDSGYKGAFTFYAHPRWGATWGGELMIAANKESKKYRLTLDHSWEDEYLLKEGHGIYIACKPNRLVIQKPDVWHGMNRIDSDAGDNLRVSIQGFWR